MTNEYRELLQTDLCSRLPYSVKVHINSSIEEQNQMELFDVSLESGTIGVGNDNWAFRAVPIEDEDGMIVRPYLRKMESMTKEERKEYESFIFTHHHEWDGHGTSTRYVEAVEAKRYIDWLNEHHLDYQGFIEKGLALEAPKDMYKNE